MVRNSVGANAYVSDEIFTSRAGVRIRIGNTDAEGRMAMVDVLCRAKEMAVSDTSIIFTHLASTNHNIPRPPPDDHGHLDRACRPGHGALLHHHGQWCSSC